MDKSIVPFQILVLIAIYCNTVFGWGGGWPLLPWITRPVATAFRCWSSARTEEIRCGGFRFSHSSVTAKIRVLLRNPEGSENSRVGCIARANISVCEASETANITIAIASNMHSFSFLGGRNNLYFIPACRRCNLERTCRARAYVLCTRENGDGSLILKERVHWLTRDTGIPPGFAFFTFHFFFFFLVRLDFFSTSNVCKI